jgi:hypothetical protein
MTASSGMAARFDCLEHRIVRPDGLRQARLFVMDPAVGRLFKSWRVSDTPFEVADSCFRSALTMDKLTGSAGTQFGAGAVARV